MQPLIAVMTCWRNVAAAEAIRATWAKSSPIPVKFFLGEPPKGFPRSAKVDEVVLDVLDDYASTCHKVQAIYRWARANGFTHVWKCDDDCYLVPSRLLSSGLLKFDHVGMWAQPIHLKGWKDLVECQKGFIHGGSSYLIGERALPVLCEAPVNIVSEDWWATYWIAQAGLQSWNDTRFSYKKRIFGDPLPPIPAPDNVLIAGAELITLANGRSEMFLAHRRFDGKDY